MSTIRTNSVTDSAGTGAPDFPNGLIVADGTAAAPSITNTGDTNTGIYFPTADSVSISTGGNEWFRVTSTGGTYVNGAFGLGGPNYGNVEDIMLSQGPGNPGIWLPASAIVAAYVGTATAGLAAGAIGTYAFLSRVTFAAITAGSTYAGSELRYSAALTAALNSDTNANANTNGGATPSGTWRALGSGGSASRYPITLFLRIS